MSNQYQIKASDTSTVVPSFQELLSYLPPKDHSEYEQKRTWLSHLITNNMSVFPDFVTTIGRNVHLIDIRTEADLQKTGIIPGSNWYPRTDDMTYIESIVRDFDTDMLIAIVDYNGLFSRTISNVLRDRYGFRFVAVLAGGVRLFKTFGFSMNRSTTQIKVSQFQPVSLIKLQEFYDFSQREKLFKCAGPYEKERHTLEQVAKHVEDELIQWIKMGAFTVHGRLSCIDGRGGNGCIGTPGGDMGELVLVLSTYEHLTGIDLSLSQCRYLFLHRMDTFGRFYLHTDEIAADKALNYIRANIISQDWVNKIEKELNDLQTLPDHWLTQFISHCPENSHEKILDLMTTMPDVMGCGHIRLMIAHPEQYKVRPTLIRQLLRCFFEASFWDDTADSDFIVLSGTHEETGILSVEMAHDIKLYTKVPLISPSLPTPGKHKQMFVSHPTIMTFLRKQQCEWLVDAIHDANEHALDLQTLQQHQFTLAQQQNKLQPLHELSKIDIITFCSMSRNAHKAFNPLVDLSAENHASLSLGYLAASLPIYRLVFDTEHSKCKVDFIGFVEGHKQKDPQPAQFESPCCPAHTCISPGGGSMLETTNNINTSCSVSLPPVIETTVSVSSSANSSNQISTDMMAQTGSNVSFELFSPHQFGNTNIVAPVLPTASHIKNDSFSKDSHHNFDADHHGMTRSSFSHSSPSININSPGARIDSFHVVFPSGGSSNGQNICTTAQNGPLGTQSTFGQFFGNESNSNAFSLTAALHLPDEMVHQFFPQHNDDDDDGLVISLKRGSV